jgi:hypothetical protein
MSLVLDIADHYVYYCFNSFLHEDDWKQRFSDLKQHSFFQTVCETLQKLLLSLYGAGTEAEKMSAIAILERVETLMDQRQDPR